MDLRKLSVKEFEEILFDEFLDEEDTECWLIGLDGKYRSEVLEVIVSPITVSMDIYTHDGFYSLYASDLINHELEQYTDTLELKAEIKGQGVVVVWSKYKQ